MTKLHWFRQLWAGVCGVVFFLILSVVVLVSAVQSRFFSQVTAWSLLFSENAGQPAWVYLGEAGIGFFGGLLGSPQSTRLLILGTDSITGSGRTDVRTDTIMLVTANSQTGKVSLLSVPRDLYLPDENIKVNAVYAERSEDFPNVFARFFGREIDRVLVLAPEDLGDLVDRLGGIEVEITKGFTDTRFPRGGVDVRVVRDPQVLYETVKFASGSQVLTGEAVIKYVRSRHSSDPAEGNDVARARRQREVVSALAKRLLDPTLPARPALLGSLAAWYSARWQAELSPAYLGLLAGQWLPMLDSIELQTLSLEATDLPVAATSSTLLVHPPLETYSGQWVYTLADPSGNQLQNFLDTNGL